MSLNKHEIISKCLEEVNRRIKKYQEQMQLIQETREASNPSNDPDEQGGAGEMLGDPESVAKQLNNAQQMKEKLANINVRTTSEVVKNGSLVETENNYYFISAALGKINLDNGSSVYALSTEAPIFTQMEGKKAGESFSFNGNTSKILKVQ